MRGWETTAQPHSLMWMSLPQWRLNDRGLSRAYQRKKRNRIAKEMKVQRQLMMKTRYRWRSRSQDLSQASKHRVRQSRRRRRSLQPSWRFQKLQAGPPRVPVQESLTRLPTQLQSHRSHSPSTTSTINVLVSEQWHFITRRNSCLTWKSGRACIGSHQLMKSSSGIHYNSFQVSSRPCKQSSKLSSLKL